MILYQLIPYHDTIIFNFQIGIPFSIHNPENIDFTKQYKTIDNNNKIK